MASIQGIYIALFGRPADPEGLAYWTQATKGGQDLSALTAMTQTPEYLNRFANKTPQEIVTSIYQSLFGRLPDEGGLTFFVNALANGSLDTIAIQILDGAQGSDALIVENKEAAADLFTASLDTPEEIAAYSGENAILNAQNLLNDVTEDPSSIPTAQDIDAAIQTLDEPPIPQDDEDEDDDAPVPDDDEDTPPIDNGGDGDPPPPVDDGEEDPPPVDDGDDDEPPPPPMVEADLTDGVLTLSGSNAYVFFVDNDVLSIVQGGPPRPEFSIPVEEVETLVITAASTTVFIAGNDVAAFGPLMIAGDGLFSINVDPALPSPDLSDLAFTDVPADGFLSPRLRVNGTVAEAFETIWKGLDQGYYAGPPNGPVGVNEAFVKLGNDYVDYLNAGNPPIDTIVQMRGGTAQNPRAQSLHDNLLGNITDQAVDGRLAAYAANDQTGYPVDLRSEAAAAFGDRPFAEGYTNNPTDEIAALAWDFVNGIVHPGADLSNRVLLAELGPDASASGPYGEIDLVGVFTSVQDAIDAANDTDRLLDVIYVAPGAYEEGRQGFQSEFGTQDFGLLIDKPVQILGIDGTGNPISSAEDVQAVISSRYQAGFGTNFFVQADNVSIWGLSFDATGSVHQPFVNKAFEIVAANFVFQNNVVLTSEDIAFYSALYFNEPGTDSAFVVGNSLQGSIALSNGAAATPVDFNAGVFPFIISGNVISFNAFTEHYYQSGLVVQGDDLSVGWLDNAAGQPHIFDGNMIVAPYGYYTYGGRQPTDFELISFATGNEFTGVVSAETIVSFDGREIFVGSSGADRFQFDADTDSPADAFDIIVNFTSGQDQIELLFGDAATIDEVDEDGISYVTVTEGADVVARIGVIGTVALSDITVPLVG